MWIADSNQTPNTNLVPTLCQLDCKVLFVRYCAVSNRFRTITTKDDHFSCSQGKETLLALTHIQDGMYKDKKVVFILIQAM